MASLNPLIQGLGEKEKYQTQESGYNGREGAGTRLRRGM